MRGTYGLALQDTRQDGEDISGGLSRPRLGLAKDILSLQRQGNGLALHECRLLKALLCDGLDEARVETELGKGRFGCLRLGLGGLGLGLRNSRYLRGLAGLVQFALHGVVVAGDKKGVLDR